MAKVELISDRRTRRRTHPESRNSLPTSRRGVHYANAPEFVTVRGRVMSADGFAIPMARVTMIGPGGESMSALSNPFGYYIFTDVRPGDVYSVRVKKKGSEFSTSPYSIYVTSAVSNVDFIADP